MTTAPTTSENATRKAAVLVRSLDPESVAALLARLSPAEAKAVRAAVRELDEVTAEDRECIAAELRGAAAPERRGVELTLGGVAPPTRDRAPETAQPPAHDPASAPTRRAFGDADSESLIACLASEQPRTVAVVLSCLAPHRAAEVLAGLPPEGQSLALDCLAELGEVDPDSLNVLAEEVDAWIAKHVQEKRRREDRMAAVRAILDATPHAARERLVAGLGSRARWLDEGSSRTHASPPAEAPPPKRNDQLPEAQAQIARAPSPCPPPTPAGSTRAPERPRFRFSQLETLDPKQLAAVFARVDTQTLILALVGSSDRLMRNIGRVASRRQARALRRNVAAVGPVRLREIHLAQEAVARAATEALAGVTDQRRASA